MKAHDEFLKFNGMDILYLNQDDEVYIAVRPICKALNVEYQRQVKKIKNHAILGPALSKRTMQTPLKQRRKYLCLPERYIYGWIFSINSDSPELIEFQKTCYDLIK